MAAVRIDLSPPPQEDVVALRIYEAAASTGPYNEIERTTNIGVYPTYISYYTTANAVSPTNWFKIAWEYQGAIIGPQSQAVQGGQGPMVIGQVIERVMQRDPSLNESIVTQEAEGVVETYFHDDPYNPLLECSYAVLNGLVLMTLYRSQLVRMVTSVSTTVTGGGDVDSFTIGLVSAKSGTAASSSMSQMISGEDALGKLLELAYQQLGVPMSVILQLAEPKSDVGLTSFDHSRMIGWVGLE